MKTEKRWVIIGRDCLYIGQSLTRIEMIAQHVSQVHYSTTGELISEFARSGKLDAEQRIAWAKSKKAGDQCVKATITWDDRLK